MRHSGLPLRALRAAALTGSTVVVVLAAMATPATANVALTQVSSDPYTDPAAQHRTEVEPDTFTFGSTIVAAFQTGRVSGGGSSNIGWATSTNGGTTWSHGFLPGITTNAGGSYAQASDPSVAFDAQDSVWLISSLGVRSGGADVLTSRSTNSGLTWSNPIVTATGSLDKNWIVCDNTASSPFFGNCYTQYDITSSGDALRMKTSTNGGVTWSVGRPTGDNATGLGGQPVVLPNGTVVVPYRSLSGQIRSFRSVDGGTSWRSTVLVSSVSHHTVAGSLRESPLPSAEVDAAGTVYVTWADCRFRASCARNDIVLSKSTSETTWAAPVRVPIDLTTSAVEHFAPGVGVDRTTSGAGARIGLTYYFYPNSSCTASTCQLDVGYISSTTGGAGWSPSVQVAGPMMLSWLPSTSQGRMFGDYISTSVLAGGRAYPVIPVASAPGGGLFNDAMYVPTGGLPVGSGTRRATAAGATASAPTPPRTLTAH